jgi:hypothetical protein
VDCAEGLEFTAHETLAGFTCRALGWC